MFLLPILITACNSPSPAFLVYMYMDIHTYMASHVTPESKESDRSMGDQGLIPGSGRSHGEGHGNPLQYFYWENPIDRGAW